MRLLVTGGTGFVMSVLVRKALEADSTVQVTVLGSPMDEAAVRYFAPVADRLDHVAGDVTQPHTWRSALPQDITHVVHGATITPISRGTVTEAQREPEAENPARIVEVNTMGTVAILEWARTLPRLERFLYVSSGGVYRNHGPDRTGEPLPEDGYLMPRKLYGITKLASELITDRYAELFRFSAASVRPASVYGTMDRVTASRSYRHVPNRLAHMALDGGLRVRVNTLDAVGDYIHSEDVAAGMITLLRAPVLRYGSYNIGSGRTVTTGDLVRWIAEKVPGFHAEISPPEHADIVQDASLTSGMWGAYDISRITAETGWRPRTVREGLHAYLDWIAAERSSSQPQEPT